MTAEPQFARLQNLVSSPQTRHHHTTEMVTTYYELVSDICQAGWGDSHHFPPLRPHETLAAAQTRSERALADRARLTTGQWALDIGSGVGGPALTIAQHSNAQVVGIDLSHLRTTKARERAARIGPSLPVQFVEGDATRLPFPDATFDVCYSFEAICHMPDKLQVHTEAFRVLKPGGRYLGYDWLAADGLDLADHEQYIEPICQYHGIPDLDTPTQLDERLRQAGFAEPQVTPVESPADMHRTWDLLERHDQLAHGLNDPVIAFMSSGAKALYQGARANKFTIGRWEAEKRPVSSGL
ncbi:methyltransferase domain-containing protein [Streptomyces microflavus]|uniref:class I SAM-dependent methyltransferase n=1 Tax=Streptomyces microflavus TaxID=1919 RepID=UPI00344728D6